MFTYVFHDESEIEEWYDEARHKLDKRLYDATMKRKNYEGMAAKYADEHKKLLHKYEQHQLSLMERQLRLEKFQGPFIRFRNWRASMKVRLKMRWKKWKRELRRRWFEREYKKLMKKNSLYK